METPSHLKTMASEVEIMLISFIDAQAKTISDYQYQFTAFI
jgi:hypothetical protein